MIDSFFVSQPFSGKNTIRHYERIEPQLSREVRYLIKIAGRNEPYDLEVESMNLNLYATGNRLLVILPP